ncbi:formate dehydrogenase [Bradyrhizobium genosp. A]|uniref:formate dehydrogenase n=1 Tax=Bradyrhizobium genosp. A TaxID=83626 RepID=UPI003CF1E6E9
MKADLERKFLRRDFLRLAIAGAAVTGSQFPEPAQAAAVDLKNKRRARYRADSVEVRNFYRVNSYPAR